MKVHISYSRRGRRNLSPFEKKMNKPQSFLTKYKEESRNNYKIYPRAYTYCDSEAPINNAELITVSAKSLLRN